MGERIASGGTERPAEQWRCTACNELWNSINPDEHAHPRCPECRGPLRLVSRPLVYRDKVVERALVAVSSDQQWLVVHWPDYRTPWTVLKRLDDMDGYRATGDRYPDTGQNASEILTAFLAARREHRLALLEHTAAD